MSSVHGQKWRPYDEDEPSRPPGISPMRSHHVVLPHQHPTVQEGPGGSSWRQAGKLSVPHRLLRWPNCLEARPENNGEAIGNQKDKKLLKADIVSLKHLPAFASRGGNPHGCAKWHPFTTNSALRRPVPESRVGV